MNNKYLQLVAAFVFGAIVSGLCVFFASKHHARNKDRFNFVEIVEYKLKNDIQENDHKQVNYDLNKELKSFSGFVSRVLSKTNDGKYYDIITWNEKQNYVDAQEKIKNNEIAQKYISQIDKNSIKTTESDTIFVFYKHFCGGKKCKKDRKDGIDKAYKLDSNYDNYKKYKKCLKKAQKDQNKLNEDDCKDAKNGFDAFVAKNGDVFKKSEKANKDKNDHRKSDEHSGNKYSK